MEFYLDQDGEDRFLSKRRHKKSFSDCLNSMQPLASDQKNYNMFQNPMLPQDFLNFLNHPRESHHSFYGDAQKKVSFYFSDEILNYENKSVRISKPESVEDRNSTVHKITDMNITKLIEDIEYEDLKKRNQFEQSLFQIPNIDLYPRNFNNYNIDTYQTYKSISQNNLMIEPAKHLNTSQSSIDKKKNNFQTCDEQDLNRYTGQLKFFDENKNYGFLGALFISVKDDDMTDVFVHFDDL